ncbi:MAG: hypothetical protein A3I44_02675 [Candidatus Sungbacteria bacterium RIFCSPLOWO2_02_FULL_51_17]|uniref:Uncharacterized protein n=1 Tax=Candidatus Sungbacteria bacterium RIFCSPHIGHO2_02_FULL_51_29 TaxID=1802273 RepID=A0A1G2KYK1_9BACT|nr:MAG: hypothetical protein A2676_01310 [Candidatus Sungbacteria bacterium RIFCSPHIGHO2_01_FULL_51_22]OHA03562.1 MAG: hypothetical protein A3C16_04730 [Candidatus Sungbacteria bacterium RIFCSPHIGHO2_02_FULL_51_29]OHA04972.1 MAG: hypothetical protein A3B29_00500 [Candidatus Sungbacteria bacterium RIFCSPLOWO2_01_FULL_51_34]OHA10805.1 MAG: hypothetical protein A3I44_02675 [Candidatus Sungbacteria bacterium RIFCSPLOWO2_02_FULL_51_17]
MRRTVILTIAIATLLGGCATVELFGTSAKNDRRICYEIAYVHTYQDTFLGQPVGETKIDVLLQNGFVYKNANPRRIGHPYAGYTRHSRPPRYCPNGIPRGN